jgi:hypothetical protein
MAQVFDFKGITKLDLEPDRVLTKAIGELSEVVIVGFDKDGEAFFASSVADAGQALWHLERAKWRLMQMVDHLESGT